MKKRNSSIELLRIFAMLMIIMSHLSGHGILNVTSPEENFRRWAGGAEVNKIFAILLVPGGRVGVGLFFMITGYFQVCKNKISINKVIIETLFYSILIQVIAYISGIGTFNNLLRSIIPLSNNSWWFTSSYVFLMVCSSFINEKFLPLDRKKKLFVITFVWVFMYCIPYNGAMYYSAERGLLYYLIGAFIRTELDLNSLKSKKRYGLFLIFLVAWLSYLPIGYVYYSSMADNTLFDLIFDAGIFNGVIVPLCASTVFLFFVTIGSFYNKWINIVAGSTFGIYILHDTCYRNFFWNDIINIQIMYRSRLFPLYASMIGILIFLVFCFLDLIRTKLFDCIGNLYKVKVRCTS